MTTAKPCSFESGKEAAEAGTHSVRKPFSSSFSTRLSLFVSRARKIWSGSMVVGLSRMRGPNFLINSFRASGSDFCPSWNLCDSGGASRGLLANFPLLASSWSSSFVNFLPSAPATNGGFCAPTSHNHSASAHSTQTPRIATSTHT